ncbi:MAG: DivIVA domain-containing protein [Bacilli bacterium]
MVNKFSTSIQGYNKEEVNNFVKEVIVEYENMLVKLKKSYQYSEELKKELKHYKDIESTLNRAILVAEESTSNIKKAAYDESKTILEDARRNATKVINNALVKAERIESEAESLRRKVMVYKRRFRALVEDQLDEMENFDDKVE